MRSNNCFVSRRNDDDVVVMDDVVDGGGGGGDDKINSVLVLYRICVFVGLNKSDGE